MTANELKEQLANQYPIRIEMHIHTRPVSKCSEVTPCELADVYGNKGYDAMVLTNHFIYPETTNDGDNVDKETFLETYMEAYRQLTAACEKKGIKVFLGAEIRFTENCNDYLIYGVNKEILSTAYDYLPKGIEAYRSNVKLDNSVFVMAHPFRNGISIVDPQLLDGVEVFNMHPGHNSRIGIASKFAKRNHIKIKTAGSDFHHVNMDHECVSALRTKHLPKDSFELAQILKSGDYILEIGNDSLILP